MYKIMVVDDEPFIADGLADLFNQIQEPCFEVSVAYSAQSALEQLDKIRMDIVISDIKMPKMNGIEMLAEIKERWPFCHVIFLSGYSDFDYVQSALTYGADSYLLKSQSDEAILETVFQTIKAIEKEKDAEDLQRRIAAEYEYALPILQKDFISQLLRSGASLEDSEIQHKLDCLRIPLLSEFPVMLIGARIDKANLSSAISTEMAAKIDAVFMEYISPKANAFYVFEGHRYLFWLIQKKSHIYSNDTLYRYIIGTLERIQLCCSQINLSVSFVWDPVLYSWGQVTHGYNHLRSIVYFLLNPKEEMVLCDTTFFHSFMEQDDGSPTNPNGAILDDMRIKLEYGQMEELLSCIDKILAQVSDNSDPICQISAYHGLCTFFLDWIERTGQKRAYLQEFSSFSVFSLPYSQWTPSMIQTFRDIAQFLINGSTSTQAQRFHQIVQTLHQYILDHLAEDLTLTTLAAQVYLNPVYLSRAYRQATGQKLSEYVLECRIKEAKKLLKSRDHKINEIAFAVGFDSAAHFSRVFKKQTSLTPLEYRERSSLK